jgi:hypothetical protein
MSAETAIHWVTGDLSTRIKRPWREVSDLPPSSSKVKNEWKYTSTLPLRFHGIYRDSLKPYSRIIDGLFF